MNNFPYAARSYTSVAIPPCILAAFFIAHVSYLTFRHRFNYGYNMAAMVTISVVHRYTPTNVDMFSVPLANENAWNQRVSSAAWRR